MEQHDEPPLTIPSDQYDGIQEVTIRSRWKTGRLELLLRQVPRKSFLAALSAAIAIAGLLIDGQKGSVAVTGGLVGVLLCIVAEWKHDRSRKVGSPQLPSASRSEGDP
jgi:hypothetical protein